MKRRRYSPLLALSNIGQVPFMLPLHMETFSLVSYVKPSWASSKNLSMTWGAIYPLPITYLGCPRPWANLWHISKSLTSLTLPPPGLGEIQERPDSWQGQKSPQGVISKFNKDPEDPNAKLEPITDAEVRDFREWDYFPHFNCKQLDHGFYAKFNALQGHKNTYYVSGINSFKTIELVICAG
jgi:hypothetical protein